METLWQDLRYGLRILLRQPGFAAVATLTLALGIGANTAIFSVVNAVLLRPLPYPHPDQLVQVWNTNLKRGWNRFAITVRHYVEWRKQSQVCEQMAAYRWRTFTLTDRGEPEEISGTEVSASLFSTLGVSPSLGRAFLPEEERPGGPRAVVVSYGLWQRRFGADSNLINQTITLNGSAYTVVGIMPRGFEFPIHASKTDLWAPLVFQPAELERGGNNLSVIGRLKPDVKLRQAQTELGTIARRFDEQRSAKETDHGVRVISLHEQVAGDVQAALVVLLGAVGCVLLIACANVANLLLARSAARQKEMAVRLALGAGRWRLMAQLLTESTMLAVIGGALGLLLARSGVSFLVAISPVNIPRVEQVSLDGRVLAFTLLVSLLTGLFFGLAPALQASKANLSESLKEGGRQFTSGASRRRLRHLLVVTEMALALMLLIGAGLMLKSFVRLYRVDSGINVHNVLTAALSLSSSQYRGLPQQIAFSRQLLEHIRALPEVQAAGLTSDLPLRGGAITESFTIEGRPASSPDSAHHAGWYVASPDYFRALSIPLLRGRDFTEQDSETALRVVVINQTMAERFWPGEDPIGRRLKIADEPAREIIGVVGDTKHMGLDKETMPEMYVPYAQARYFFYMQLVVRTTADPTHLAAAVRQQVLAINPNQPVAQIKTMEQYLAESVAHPRFRSILLGLFAALAMVLAAVGLYGVMSYSISQRTPEIGIRLALGARPRDVLKLVVGQGMKLTLLGVVMGLGGAFALTRVLKSFLYEVSATDPLTYAAISLLLAGVALLACYLPARRAMAVDPMVALRCE